MLFFLGKGKEVPCRYLQFFHFSVVCLVIVCVGNAGGGAFAANIDMVIILPVLQQGQAMG